MDFTSYRINSFRERPNTSRTQKHKTRVRILVTGKDGQLAQSIHSITALYTAFDFIFKSSSELDITNYQLVAKEFKKNRIDYCINCAAYTAVDKAETDAEKAYNVNVVGVKNLANACAENEATLISVSTDFVFDGNSNKPYLEKDFTNPIGVYGKTKLEGEQLISKLLVKHFIIRTSWLYSEYGNNFMKTMLRLGRERDELSVIGDQIGSPTYAVDLAKAIMTFIEIKETNYGVYHFSNKGECSWYDFAKEIFAQSNIEIKLSKITTEDFPTAAKRPKYSVLNSSKIEKSLGIEIHFWKESLKQAILNLNEN